MEEVGQVPFTTLLAAASVRLQDAQRGMLERLLRPPMGLEAVRLQSRLPGTKGRHMASVPSQYSVSLHCTATAHSVSLGAALLMNLPHLHAPAQQEVPEALPQEAPQAPQFA